MISKIPKFIQKAPWQKHLWRVPSQEKVVYFTFDDGPTPVVTEKTLEILKQFNAKATFFCLGRNVDRYPELLQKILDDGHRVGNHSYSHIKGFLTKTDTYEEDVQLATKHIKSKLFRPPYGRIRRAQARRLAKTYQIVMWEILSHDYNRNISPKKCTKNVLKNVKPGSIIVFHDSIKAAPNLLASLPVCLKTLSKKGYRFESIPYCF